LQNSIINFIKGIFIGAGAILPGLSGGALAAIFGVYESLINFASNLKKDFKKNITFFIPVILGGLFGIFILSHVLSYFLERHLIEISLFFVGCMLGIFPALVKQASREGRKKSHLFIAIGSTLLSFWLLTRLTTPIEGITETSIGTWTLSGSIIGLGITFPGMSPSNFLMYLNLYQPLNEAISQLNFAILIPVAIGVLTSFILTAKLVAYLLKIAYGLIFHIIIGLVLTSTVMIVPTGFELNLINILCLTAGIGIGVLMSKLESRAH